MKSSEMNNKRLPKQPVPRVNSRERAVRLPAQSGRDRRAATRYPLTLALRYVVPNRHGSVAETGAGQTVDFSSSGLRFSADGPLKPGLTVELFIDWPLLLDDGVQLQLTITGKVVRSSGTETALRIRRHGFRTRGRGLKTA